MPPTAQADVAINPSAAERWRRHRFDFLASLVEGDLTGGVLMPLQPPGEPELDLPDGLGDQIQPLLDAIKALPPADSDTNWQVLYRAVYNLVRQFMAAAPGFLDQTGNHQIAALNDNIDHVPKLAELCQKFDKHAASVNATSEEEQYKAVSDVMYAGQKEVLVSAGMKASDFLPIAVLVRKINKLLTDFRQSQKLPVAEDAKSG